MLRRDLIRSMVGLPMLRPEQWPSGSVTVQVSEKHILIFYDIRTINVDTLTRIRPPKDGTVYSLIPVFLNRDQNIEDAIRLYEIK